MNKFQMLGTIDKMITQVHNAMDEIGDIQDNEASKHAAIHYLVQVEMNLYQIIDEIEAAAIMDGERSGAV